MFKSCFKNELTSFINEKRYFGYKYLTDESELLRFDEFLLINNITIISKECITKWVDIHPNWKINAKARSINTIRQFLKYLNKQGVNTYQIPKLYYPQKKHEFVPYIFSDKEINDILLNSLRYRSRYYHEMKYIVPLVIRLLYSTGMRIDECLSIKKSNIDTENGIIKLENTKNGSDRLIVIDDDLNNEIRMYMNKVKNDYELLFSNKHGTKMAKSTIEKAFYYILKISNISRTENTPRLHDLRFTYIVHSFRNYCKTGKDPRDC